MQRQTIALSMPMAYAQAHAHAHAHAFVIVSNRENSGTPKRAIKNGKWVLCFMAIWSPEPGCLVTRRFGYL